MKNGMGLFALACLLGSGVARAGFRVEVATQFRPRVEPTRIKVELPDMAALRNRVGLDANVHANVLKPLMTEGGNLNGNQVFDPAKVSAEAKRAFSEYESAHKALTDAMAKYSSGKEPNDAEFADLQKLFLAREEALNSFMKEGVKDKYKFVSVKNEGHWDFAGQIKAATEAGTPLLGTNGKPVDLTHLMTASGSSRATGESIKGDPSKSYAKVMSEVKATFKDNGSIGDALSAVYSEKSITDRAAKGKDAADKAKNAVFEKEKAVLVTAKVEEIVRRLGNMKDLKIKMPKIYEMIDSMIRSEAGPAEMEALLQMVAKFDGDAGAGLGRMVGLDLQLRKAGLTSEKVGEKMNHWLAAGEDFRALVSPDNTGKSSRETVANQSLASAARDFWIKNGRMPKDKSEIDKLITDAIAKGRSEGGLRLEPTDFTKDHTDLVERAAEKLRLAAEGKGEDKVLRDAICKGECKGHFAIQCKG